MADAIHSSPTINDFHADTGPHSHTSPFAPQWSGSLRPLARALLSVAGEIHAARRAHLGTEYDLRAGSAVSFGRSVGRQPWRHRAASPDVTGPANANPHVEAPAGSPVVNADLMGSSS